jgi:alpha-N-arabinofuranosidase
VHETARWGEVPLLDSVAVLDEESNALTLFAVNRDQREPMAVDLDVRGLPGLFIGEHTTLTGDDPDAVNDAENPDLVSPRRLDDVKLDGGRAQVVLPPLSWNMVRLNAAP